MDPDYQAYLEQSVAELLELVEQGEADFVLYDKTQILLASCNSIQPPMLPFLKRLYCILAYSFWNPMTPDTQPADLTKLFDDIVPSAHVAAEVGQLSPAERVGLRAGHPPAISNISIAYLLQSIYLTSGSLAYRRVLVDANMCSLNLQQLRSELGFLRFSRRLSLQLPAHPSPAMLQWYGQWQAAQLVDVYERIKSWKPPHEQELVENLVWLRDKAPLLYASLDLKKFISPSQCGVRLQHALAMQDKAGWQLDLNDQKLYLPTLRNGEVLEDVQEEDLVGVLRSLSTNSLIDDQLFNKWYLHADELACFLHETFASSAYLCYLAASLLDLVMPPRRAGSGWIESSPYWMQVVEGLDERYTNSLDDDAVSEGWQAIGEQLRDPVHRVHLKDESDQRVTNKLASISIDEHMPAIVDQVGNSIDFESRYG